MSDVFVSYARSSDEQAERIAAALRSQGFRVWRDDELPAHRVYAEVIEERLRAAKAVVVIWSADAAKSQWVRAEADAAREAGTLVQVSVDGTVPPMPFNQMQCADLTNWMGDREAHGWRKLAGSVAALLGDVAQTASQPSPRKHKLSICVLPFANMSGDVEQEYFSDGISEDITTDLSNVSALSVVARNTAFTFKGKSVDVAVVARQLGVTHVLGGSVRKSGSRVRIAAQLIDGSSGDHLWAERFDRDLTDIFDIQDEISRAIVAALKLKLLPEEKKAIEQRGTSSAEAYNLYLMARNYWSTGNHGDRRREERVVRICQRAIEIDQSYARAWALMALAQATLRFGFGKEGDDGLAAAERALSLDRSIAEAHCVLARHYTETGREADAESEIAVAIELDPYSWEVNKEAARICMEYRRIPEAARHFERAIATMETDFHGWGMLVSCYKAMGDARLNHAAKTTVAQVETVMAQDPSNGAAASFGVMALAALGEEHKAREWINRGLLLDPDNLNMRYNFACSLVTLNDKEGALALLKRNFEEVSGTHIRMVETDPDMDNIRDDPRFQKMLSEGKARLGIVSHPKTAC